MDKGDLLGAEARATFLQQRAAVSADHRAEFAARFPDSALTDHTDLYRRASRVLSLIDMGFAVQPCEVPPQTLEAARIVAATRQELRRAIADREKEINEANKGKK